MLQIDNVQTLVLNSLYWDLAVPPHMVNVEVENGFVTLHGEVERTYQRSCAEEDVRRVPGVIGVTNEIVVRAAVQRRFSAGSMLYEKDNFQYRPAKPSAANVNFVFPGGPLGAGWVLVVCGPHGVRPRRLASDRVSTN